MENNEPQNNKIKSILERIENNELKIRPKTFFRLRLAALIVVVFMACIVLVFLSSFILFTIRASGQASLIGFGPSGWQVFLILFPWKLFLFALLLIVILEWLLRSFRFGYKLPVLYLLLGVCGLMIVTGFIVDRFHLHDNLLRRAESHRLPFFEGTYVEVRRAPPRGHGLFRGTITSISAMASTSVLTVEVEDPRSATTTLYKLTVPNTEILSSVKVDDRVFIMGDLVNGEIRARGIRIAPSRN